RTHACGPNATPAAIARRHNTESGRTWFTSDVRQPGMSPFYHYIARAAPATQQRLFVTHAATSHERPATPAPGSAARGTCRATLRGALSRPRRSATRAACSGAIHRARRTHIASPRLEKSFTLRNDLGRSRSESSPIARHVHG